jgi:sugar-specific transcriptional regulator TrmB
MDYSVLRDIGFNEKEVDIYKTLLQLGISPASKVAKEIGFDRTSTYYLLQRMLEKGWVAEVIKSNTKTYSATSPKQIFEIIKEKTLRFQDFIPKLEEISHKQNDELNIEIRQGIEGFRYIYRDAISIGTEVLGLGSEDEKYIDIDKIGLFQYYRDAQKKGIRERIITYRGAKTYDSKITRYRFLEKEDFHSSPIFIYGNKVVLISWYPTINLIFIENKNIATGFKKHFELLWKISKD